MKNYTSTFKCQLYQAILHISRSFEVILIIDCSKDKSYEICDNIVFCDQRFKVKHLPKNNGVSNARNFGISKASGKYILFIDCDDFWEKDLLKVLNNNLKENDEERIKIFLLVLSLIAEASVIKKLVQKLVNEYHAE